MPPLSLLIPHHFIIVSGRATRLVDTQSGKRGAMMNCSLLVLSMMIIINFPRALAGEWGAESCGVAAPPPWAVTELTIITYHRQSLGPRLNADENESAHSQMSCFLCMVVCIRGLSVLTHTHSFSCSFFCLILNPPSLLCECFTVY